MLFLWGLETENEEEGKQTWKYRWSDEWLHGGDELYDGPPRWERLQGYDTKAEYALLSRTDFDLGLFDREDED